MNAPISPLVADLITASLSVTHQTTDRLVDSLTAQLADREAELAAIRWSVGELLAGDYMPMPWAIQRALHPSAELVDRFREVAT